MNEVYGTSSQNIQAVQYELQYLAQRDGRSDFNPVTTSGSFDDSTLAAVKAFQAAMSLPITGIIDDATYNSLQAVLQANTGTVNYYTPAPTSTSGVMQSVSSALTNLLNSSVTSPISTTTSTVKSSTGISGMMMLTIVGLGLTAYMLMKPKRSRR